MPRKYTLTKAALKQRAAASKAAAGSRPRREYRSIRLGADTVAAVDQRRGAVSRDRWIMQAATS